MSWIFSFKNNVRYLLLSMFLLATILSVQSHAASITSCNTTIVASNATFVMNNSQCTAINIVFARGVANSRLECNNISLSSRSNIIFSGLNNEDYLFNCSFNGAKIILGNDSFADIVSPLSTDFIPVYNGSNVSLTVGYFLNISVFEPFGSNTVAAFGNRIAAFGYILPLFNNSIHINNTQLQMVPSFSTYISNLISKLNKTMQFGVYGQNQTEIYTNFTHKTYGNIFGYKKFMLPSYTLTNNGIIHYNPYAIEYSFLGYDQLVMYYLNITKNTNLMPVYIEPIYPKFNYNIIPDNGQRNITIKWLVAVPPQDLNWNFSAYLYRYSTSIGFVSNPLNNSIQNGTSLVKLLLFPSKNYSNYENGTYMFYLNYSTKIGIGLNSSIILLPGYIPGEGNFIQDSTTPSFSYGLSFCSTFVNTTSINNYINKKGTYTMTNRLFPLSGAAPVLVNASCYVGAYINGTNITINCNNGTIVDTHYAFIINKAKNVKLSKCNIYGDGILISNSTGISVYNTAIYPTAESSAYGIDLYNSSNVNFTGVKIFKGFSYPYLNINSTEVNFYTSSINITGNTSTISITTIPTSAKQSSFFWENQTFILYAATTVVVLLYIYLFFKLQYKPTKPRQRVRRRRLAGR